jgi:hypothetical protein
VHQDTQKEISSDTHDSVNTNYNYSTCSTDDEEPRLAKRRKPCSASAATPTPCPGRTPKPHLRRPRRLSSPSSMWVETDDVQSVSDTVVDFYGLQATRHSTTFSEPLSHS